MTQLSTSRLHESHESKLPFVTLSNCQIIRSKLSNFSACIPAVCGAPAGGAAARSDGQALDAGAASGGAGDGNWHGWAWDRAAGRHLPRRRGKGRAGAGDGEGAGAGAGTGAGAGDGAGTGL